MDNISIYWMRRDLRLYDNAALYHALRSGNAVLPVFIFDSTLLGTLEDKADRRVEFIHTTLQHLRHQLQEMGSDLRIFYGDPQEVWQTILATYPVGQVYANHDYEPYAGKRDAAVTALLSRHNTGFFTFKDQVVFEKGEVVKENGEPYVVFTPYSRVWKAKCNDFYLKPYPAEKYYGNFLKLAAAEMPTLEEIGFSPAGKIFPERKVPHDTIRKYAETRDFPAVNGTSRLGLHLRFGTVSIRETVSMAAKLNEKFLDELIWRDFYQMILWHFPYVVNGAFKKEYNAIAWRNNEKEFERWCNGTTGYPIVDAGMRELNDTGFMHNRVRMIVASFLTKHLLIDWRWGEAWFAQKLLDFDLASNNGGWQWAAGSGVDAAPYFRVFNPYLQTEKFDPQYRYIRKWVPEAGTPAYPAPMVDHGYARQRCLETYKKALEGGKT